MVKINELEKKWYYYKIKNFLLSAVGLSSIVLLILLGYYFYIIQKNGSLKRKTIYLTNVLGVSKVAEEPKAEKHKSISNQPLNDLNKSIVMVKHISSKKLEEVELEPIIPVIDMAKEEAIKHTKKTQVKRNSPHSKLVQAKPNSYLTAKELSQISKVETAHSSQPHVTKKMKFKTTSINYIETMQKKFLKSKNARDAILISKAFYKKANYSKSEEWALSANKLDKKLDDSWLLFAKSKAKLGKKQEAINVLANYYKKSHSAKAKLLIGQIKTGKI